MKYSLSLLLALISFSVGYAQSSTPVLERKITVNFTNEKLPAVLNRIGQLGGFSFSYNTDLIDQNQVVTFSAKDKSVREILNEIFKGTMNYRPKGKYIILSKAPAPKVTSTTSVFIISGYVEDETSGGRVPQASVYEKTTLSSAVTDEFGYYKIRLDKKNEPTTLSISKKNYRDTIVMVTAPGNQYVNITIKPAGDSVKISAVVQSDSVSEKKEEPQFPFENEANVENIHDTLYRDIQISLLPFVGSNGKLSGNVINNYSINIFGGYSLGTRQIELGFFLNADRGDVGWLQIAGIGNGVGGDSYGVQLAGIFNANAGETKAAQVAGIANTNLGETRGVQVAGIANTLVGSAHGVQVAGIANTVRGKSQGVQVAGICNTQIGDYSGSQFAGISNVATKEITGSQIAGIFNYGHTVHGTQIGLFNFSDSLGGVPIGLVSFVNHGYHKIELSADEIFYTNLAFRTGSRKFYNILMAGMKPEYAFGANKENVWSFGYGIGTAPKLNRRLDLNIDLMSSHVNKGGFTSELSLLNKLYLGVDFQVARKMSLTLGGTVNGYLTKTTYSDYPQLFTDHHPNIFYDHNFSNNVNLKMWFGWKVGLRFL